MNDLCPGRRLKLDNGLLTLCIACARQDDGGKMAPAAVKLVIGGSWGCPNFVGVDDEQRDVDCRVLPGPG